MTRFLHMAWLCICFVAPFATSMEKPAEGFTTLKGRIIYQGNLPIKKMVEAPRDKECCLRGGPLFEPGWEVNEKNRGVGWVMVWLEPDPTDKTPLPLAPSVKKPKEATVSLDIQICRYQPHVLGIREGQSLQVRNHDPIHHAAIWNTNSIVNTPGAILIPSGEKTLITLKTQSTPLQFHCPIHPWMKSYVWVFPHPYFATTDANGCFEIPHAPTGIWRLRVWHEETGWRGGKAGKTGQAVLINRHPVTDLGELTLNP